MKVYTKTGDGGTTSLYDGNKTSKKEIIFDVLGELDELSSRVGLLISQNIFDNFRNISDFLRSVQIKIQDINTIIATPQNNSRKIPEIEEIDISRIEKLIDELDNQLPPLTKFILPGVTPQDAQSHLCRTQTRKVERYLWKLHYTTQQINVYRGKKSGILNLSEIHLAENIMKYINRLSDFFFVLARWLCMIQYKNEVFK